MHGSLGCSRGDVIDHVGGSTSRLQEESPGWVYRAKGIVGEQGEAQARYEWKSVLGGYVGQERWLKASIVGHRQVVAVAAL